MKIIALHGKAQIGKTAVITKLYQKLCAVYRRLHYEPNNLDGDFTAIFEIKDKKVGITSSGDNAKDLVKPFDVFATNGCDLCVVACRDRHQYQSWDGSRNFVEDKAKGYGTNVIWYKKAYVEQSNAKYNAGLEIDEINDIQAKILLKEIELQI